MDNSLAKKLRKYSIDKGYKVFEEGDYNLNLFGIRAKESKAGTFDDRLLVSYKKLGSWVSHVFSITTDPGLFWLENPMNKIATAILKEGQYEAAWKLGLHKGRYPALVQCKPVTVYRDSNRDGILDFGTNKVNNEVNNKVNLEKLNEYRIQETGLFGINIHRAGSKRKSIQVGRWSAGCQVFCDPLEYAFFISLCREQKRRLGNRFTYTLFHDDELFSEA